MSYANLSGYAGLVIISIAIWFRNEKWQDALFIIGGLFLLIYSISIKNLIFSILQVVFVSSAVLEIIKLKKNENPK